MARLKTALVRMGDSMQSLAARELGDALAWRDLVDLNALRPPYILPSYDAADRQSGVLLWGDEINVPALSVTDSAVLGPDALGRDVLMEHGRLIPTSEGDLDLIDGSGNLGQALRHRIQTPYQSFLPHPKYGSELHAFLGLRNDAARMALGAGLARRTMLRDPRCKTAEVSGSITGDSLLLTARVQATTSDTPFDTNAVFQLPEA